LIEEDAYSLLNPAATSTEPLFKQGTGGGFNLLPRLLCPLEYLDFKARWKSRRDAGSIVRVARN
jgi:hypothetical protein